MNWDDYNYTELVAMARVREFPGFQKVGTSKGVPRETLIEMFKTFKPIDNPEALFELRARMAKWTHKHWKRLESLAAHSQCPQCMAGRLHNGELQRCTDLMVMECFWKNEDLMAL